MATPTNIIESRFLAYLRQSHIKSTRSRLTVFAAIYASPGIKPVALWSQLDPSSSKASVYRTVDLLLEKGVVTSMPDGGLEVSDAFVQHHHYLVCRHCGRRIGFWDEQLEKTIERQVKHRNFTLEDHLIELTGLCHKCRPSTPARTPIGTRIRRQPSDLVPRQR